MKLGDDAPRPSRRGRLLALVITAGLLPSGAAYAAKPVVAIAPFRGPGGKLVEGVVQRALKRQALLLSSTRYTAVAKPLFAETSSAEDVAAVCHELGAAWAVTGTIKLDGRRWALTVNLRECETGHTRAKLRYSLNGPRVPPPVQQTLQRELVESLRDSMAAPPVAQTPPPPMSDTPPTEEPSRRRSTVRPADGHDEERPPGVRAETATNPPAPSTAPESPPPPKPTPAPAPTGRPRWARWFDLSIGATLTGRRFSVDPPPPRFNSSVVGGIRGDFNLYPLASTWKNAYGIFAGLGLGVTVDKPFWPNSTSKTDTSRSFPTSELRVEGGLRWKITLYKPMPRPQLHLIAEGGLHDFSFAKGPNGEDVVGVPDVRYVYVSLGGGLTVHFADWTWIWAKFVYHVVTNSGPIQAREQYGLAAAGGLRFSGGLDFLVYKGLRVGVLGLYERFDMRFGYDPQRAKIADSATDEYYGGMLMLGYML